MVVRAVAIVPPAASKVVTVRGPEVTGSGGAEPSARTRKSWVSPRSSAEASSVSSSSHTGAGCPTVLWKVRSRSADAQTISSAAMASASTCTTPTFEFCGIVRGSGWPSRATRVPSGETDGLV